MTSILVTGASTGIGQACALHLDRLGHRVYAGVRNEQDEARLRDLGSARLAPVFLDVTDQAQIDAVAKQIREDGGALRGVVNNAGVARGGPLEYLAIDEWRYQFEVNVIGQVAVTKAMLPLVRAGNGRIVFIGSISGKSPSMMLGPYSASKFAIEAIGSALRQELHPWGIAVSVVEPGAVKTEIWEKGRSTTERLERDLPAEATERYRRHMDAIRRLIDMQERQGVGPEKVAAAVEHALFAKRPKTRYLVGPDARIQSAMVRLLPDRAVEAALRLLTRT